MADRLTQTQEGDSLEAMRVQLNDLLNDFLWLLEQHPEHDGSYARDRIALVEEAMRG